METEQSSRPLCVPPLFFPHPLRRVPWHISTGSAALRPPQRAPAGVWSSLCRAFRRCLQPCAPTADLKHLARAVLALSWQRSERTIAGCHRCCKWQRQAERGWHQPSPRSGGMGRKGREKGGFETRSKIGTANIIRQLVGRNTSTQEDSPTSTQHPPHLPPDFLHSAAAGLYISIGRPEWRGEPNTAAGAASSEVPKGSPAPRQQSPKQHASRQLGFSGKRQINK